jgi:glucose-1-phosphate thymidylyltransferase
MNVLILAGGYAKRMWPLTKDTPKALLPIGNKTALDLIMQNLEKVNLIDKISVSTNKRFADQFEEWKQKSGHGEVKIVVENTTCEEEKLGAIKAINFALKQENIEDDCLIIAGDNLFDFNLNNLIEFAKDKPALLVSDVREKEKASQCGVISVNDEGKIIDFEEKPENPKSTLVSTACYFFPKHSLKFFDEYLTEGNHPDAVGYFIQWLHKKTEMKALPVTGKWYDIGDKDTYKKVQTLFS